MTPMQNIRDQVVALIEEHEQAEHDGAPCVERRIDAIAYLAHSLGLRPRLMSSVAAQVEKYDANCPCRRPVLREPGQAHGEL